MAIGCSAGDPVQPRDVGSEESESGSETDDDAETEGSAAESGAVATATAVVEPTLSDQDLAEIVDLAAGEQTQDAQGNLVAIYGYTPWSETLETLPDQVQSALPFVADVQVLTDPDLALLALDVGMCSAGLDATRLGTAEFFVHESPDQVLSTDPVRGRGVLARHPILQPGFAIPKSAECTRGWLPVVWSGAEPPTTARYVLASRETATAELERHVYQWALEPVPSEPRDGYETFGVDQTVTFNRGPLLDTTVVLDGWAEFVGRSSSLEGTRLVGVSLTYCQSGDRSPQFGLAVDGWNVIAPDQSSLFDLAVAIGNPEQSCFEGWLDFVVPHGAVPTGFFVSDLSNASTGYAEWSLANAAVPAPG